MKRQNLRVVLRIPAQKRKRRKRRRKEKRKNVKHPKESAGNILRTVTVTQSLSRAPVMKIKRKARRGKRRPRRRSIRKRKLRRAGRNPVIQVVKILMMKCFKGMISGSRGQKILKLIV